MKEFLLLFRMDILTKDAQPTDAQMKKYMVQWMKWIDGITAKGQLIEGGNHLLPVGTVLRKDFADSNKPYVARKESVTGYIIILAKDMKLATAIAKKCPILKGDGTSVEVREIATSID